MRMFVGVLLAGLGAAGLQADIRILDNFDSADAWRVLPADGVEARLSVEPGVDGPALRLDFDFTRGSGFVVVRRELDLDLPENYRFTFDVRGESPPNNLEFKLVDGDNVWWVNRRAFEFPRNWDRIRYKRRHVQFAWGPSGSKPLTHINAIELAVASSSGGRGYVVFDRLTFEPLPTPKTGPFVLKAATSGIPTPVQVADDGAFSWRSAPGEQDSFVRLDLGESREFGGLFLNWGEDFARDYDVTVSTNGRDWERVAEVRGSNGGGDYVRLPDAEASQIRIESLAPARGETVSLRGVRVLPATFGESWNKTFAAIAAESPRGRYPRYFSNEQQPWTVVGVDGDDKEGLFDVAGALELDRLGVRVEPFIFVGDKLSTWADAKLTQSLDGECLPIPSVEWNADGVRLGITAVGDGDSGDSRLVARYRVKNTSSAAKRGALYLAIRPFQVLPPWQELNITGGASKLSMIQYADGVARCDDHCVVAWTRPDAFGASTFDGGEIVECISAGKLPTDTHVEDPHRMASAAMRFDFDLAPGAEKSIVISSPLTSKTEAASAAEKADPAAAFAGIVEHARKRWKGEIERVELVAPPSATRIVNTFKSQQAYILINADGPAIQPGSRTYERSWIRDGSLTSTALLFTGHAERVKAFIEWYAKNQYPSGKIPCVVDRRGPDPVPENDSTGQFIYLVWTYYQFTHDRTALEQYLPRVVSAVEFIEAQRAERMTPEYRDGPPEKRVLYGLVPESISHEGYSAKPMHSYWDGFFTLRGLGDASSIAATLGRSELEQRFARLRDDYRTCMYDSMRLAMKNRGIDFIPGCAELGDFDATSTAVGVYPCGELGLIPEPQLGNTFARYLKFFRDRRDGRIEWRDYTPYEVRLINTFVRLGQPETAHELAGFFLADQRPPGWNQWGEVVWRDPDAPRYVGDMPHTWVGSDFVSAVRTMFVYEDEHASRLFLGAGLKPEWLASQTGAGVRRAPTRFGELSYLARADDGGISVEIDCPPETPEGGIVFVHSPERALPTVKADGATAERLDERRLLIRPAQRSIRVRLTP
ncbi:MAG: discoidin domain-containing protein [Phycisphaerae bacterium]